MSPFALAAEQQSFQVLIIDANASSAAIMQRVAESLSCRCIVVSTGSEAKAHLRSAPFDIAVIDLDLTDIDALDLLKDIRVHHPGIECLMTGKQESLSFVVQALRMGAHDSLNKPFDDISLLEVSLEKILEKISLLRRLHSYEEQFKEIDEYSGLVGKSSAMRQIYGQIQNTSHSESYVLIEGESGTGKEMVARAIYQNSPRMDKPFVVISCASLDDDLLAKELFGQVSDVDAQVKKGLLLEANGGTVFLDEINEISLHTQAALLRVLQDKQVQPLGSETSYPIDIRVIAAADCNLHDAMLAGLFREDLYYCLQNIGMYLPPLCERKEDIPLLSYHFLSKYANRTGKRVEGISADALQTLQDYNWPGNVRELENIIERAVVLTSSNTLTARDFPPKILSQVFYQKEYGDSRQDWLKMTYREAKGHALAEFNLHYVSNLLRQTTGNISMAAQHAGMDRNNFKKIINKYEINAKAYKKIN